MGAVARTQLRQTPVMGNRTCVGLDVHARSVWACAVDDESGEMRTQRISPKTPEVVKWVKALPGDVEVAYEAGPTGFSLARSLIAAGVRCQCWRRRRWTGRPEIGQDRQTRLRVDRPIGTAR